MPFIHSLNVLPHIPPPGALLRVFPPLPRVHVRDVAETRRSPPASCFSFSAWYSTSEAKLCSAMFSSAFLFFLLYCQVLKPLFQTCIFFSLSFSLLFIVVAGKFRQTAERGIRGVCQRLLVPRGLRVEGYQEKSSRPHAERCSGP